MAGLLSITLDIWQEFKRIIGRSIVKSVKGDLQ